MLADECPEPLLVPGNDLSSRTGQVLRSGAAASFPARDGRHPAVPGGGIGHARVLAAIDT
jgi:hypothetical protein